MAILSLNLPRLHRAVIEPADWRHSARHAFVEASSHHAAVKRIAAAVGGLEYRSPVTVEERITNVLSAQELVAEGLSDDVELRLFEAGWSYGKPTYVREPLFLLDAPAELIRVWARCPQEEAPTP